MFIPSVFCMHLHDLLPRVRCFIGPSHGALTPVWHVGGEQLCEKRAERKIVDMQC